MLNPKHLIQSTLAAASAALYTAAGVKTRIDALTVTNSSGAGATFSIWLVPPSGTANNDTLLIKDRSIGAGSSARVLEAIGQWIEAGWAIHASSNIAGVLALNASGIEQTTS